MKTLFFASAALALATGLPLTSAQALDWPGIKYVEVEGLGKVDYPIAIRHAGDGSGRLFIVGRQGEIHAFDNGKLTPFLDISKRVQSSGNMPDEQGLLGIAFPPGFGKGKDHFYLYYTAKKNRKQILSRFSLKDKNTADPDSEKIIVEYEDPYGNHNGGDIHFGKDGYLYVGTGDGGSADDPKNAAQDPKNLLGKILRIDVEGAGGEGFKVPKDNPFVGQEGVLPEIWHLGLRNPWRWSFDRDTGAMWIGDVGQNVWEEISYAAPGAKGLNYGWRRYEGFHLRPPEPKDENDPKATKVTIGTLTEPLTETLHTEGDLSLTGGYVYRGKAFPKLNGIYFFADYQSTRVYALQKDGDKWEKKNYDKTGYHISAFGEDENGEVYLADLGTQPNSGRIYRIVDAGAK